MKVCLIQPPYYMESALSDICFDAKMNMLDACNETLDVIVLPEYSDLPCATYTKEETIRTHKKYIVRLLDKVQKTARRCKAIVFVNALSEEETGFRNTTYVFDRDGNLAGKYFKRHIPKSELDMKIDESYNLSYTESDVIEIEGVRYGFLTCYDFYFYEAVSNIARQNVDVIIGCSLQRSDPHHVLEMMGQFTAYNTNAYLLRSSVSLGEKSMVGGCSMIVVPEGRIIANLKSSVGVVTASIDPQKKFFKAAGFGNPPAAHYEYIEAGRNPWQYRPAGSAISVDEKRMPYPRICAHRGFSAVLPENSLPAFGAAVAMGAEEIEFDLWATKDGELVSMHDATLDRVSDGSGFVYEKTLDELKKLDFGIKHGEKFKGIKIVTFEEILKKLGCHTIMNIHIKTVYNACEYSEEVLRKIVKLIDKYDCRKHIYFMCENDNFHKLAKRICPDIPLCCGAGDKPWEIVDRAIELGCSKVQFYKPYFNQEMVDKAHENGIICNVFWADEQDEAQMFLDMGIDTVLTNEYGLVSQIIK